MTQIQNPAQTGAAVKPAEFPGKTLGIVGLVLAILLPLIGLIVSLVAQNQSKKAGFANSPAKIGVIIGAILVGLYIVGLIITIGFTVAAANA